jgi:hypothetical protein
MKSEHNAEKLSLQQELSTLKEKVENGIKENGVKDRKPEMKDSSSQIDVNTDNDDGDVDMDKIKVLTSSKEDSDPTVEVSAPQPNGITSDANGEIHTDKDAYVHVSENDITPKAGTKDKGFFQSNTEGDKIESNPDDPISPLGMTSPLAAPDRSKRRPRSAAPRSTRIPKTVKTDKKRSVPTTRKTATPVKRSAKTPSKLEQAQAPTSPSSTRTTPRRRIVSKRKPSSTTRDDGSNKTAPATPKSRRVSARNTPQAKTSTKPPPATTKAQERMIASTSRK